MGKILAKVNAVFADDGTCLLNVGHEKSLKADMKLLGDDIRRGDKIEFEGQVCIEEVTLDDGETFDGKYLVCPDMKVIDVQKRPRVAEKNTRAISLSSKDVVEPPFVSDDSIPF